MLRRIDKPILRARPGFKLHRRQDAPHASVGSSGARSTRLKRPTLSPMEHALCRQVLRIFLLYEISVVQVLGLKLQCVRFGLRIQTALLA